MMEKSKPSERRERISVATNEGLLTEEDLSRLLDLSIKTVVDYIDEDRLPGRRVGPQGTRVRTLTSVRQLVEFAEGKADWSKPVEKTHQNVE